MYDLDPGNHGPVTLRIRIKEANQVYQTGKTLQMERNPQATAKIQIKEIG